MKRRVFRLMSYGTARDGYESRHMSKGFVNQPF